MTGLHHPEKRSGVTVEGYSIQSCKIPRIQRRFNWSAFRPWHTCCMKKSPRLAPAGNTLYIQNRAGMGIFLRVNVSEKPQLFLFCVTEMLVTWKLILNLERPGLLGLHSAAN